MPFTTDAFFAVFAAYNAAIWPLQIAAYAGGAAVLGLLVRPVRGGDAAILLVLAAMWAVNAIGYHLTHFAPVNPAARLFAAAFVLEALLLAAATFARRKERAFTGRTRLRTGTGIALMLFALAGYPVLGALAGHSYPATPMFGVAPCPTTIFTIGALVLAAPRMRRWLLPIPLLWSAVGGSAAVLLDVPQDYALILAGLLALALEVADRRAPDRSQRTGDCG